MALFLVVFFMGVFRKSISFFLIIAIFFSLSSSALAFTPGGSFSGGVGRGDFYEFANFPGGGGSFGNFGGSRGEYDDYVSSLEENYGSTSFDEYGGLYFHPRGDDFYTGYVNVNAQDSLFSFPLVGGGSAQDKKNVLNFNVVGSEPYYISVSYTNTVYSYVVKSVSLSARFYVPVPGEYEIVSVGTVSGSYYSSVYNRLGSSFDCSAGDDIYVYVLSSFSTPYPSIPYSGVLTTPTYRVTPDESISIPEASTRPSTLFQSISNYNSEDNSTNYFIGSVDEGGNVTNIYLPNIYDEDTKIFTEPVTGTQYQTTGWIYDYTTRTYQLSLEPGTFLIGDADIDRIDLTYGDDELTISYYSGGSLVKTDTYAYVIATDQSSCQHQYTSVVTSEPTCTSPGLRTYTCTLCGHQYTEEIPATEHVYTYATTVEPTCTEPGQRTGTCSICGNEVVEELEALGHDWLPTETTQTTYTLPEGAACPDCGGTDFQYTLWQGSGSYDCTCNSCGAEWVEQAVVTYGQTTYTCSRCGEIYVDSQDGDSGLFSAIGNFIADGIGWIVDKLKQLVEGLSSINDIFSGFVEDIRGKSGAYPAFLGAAIAVLPSDLMTVFWFAVVLLVVLAVWKKFFH